MPTYRDEAVVLRTHQLGEADRIITFLTRRNGKIRAVAKGIRKTSSRFGGRLEPYCQVDIQFAEGRGSLEVVTQVEAMHVSRLAADYSRFTAAEVLVETADRLVSEEGSPAVQQYRLLAGALRALEDPQRPYPLVVDSYLLRSLAVAGYAVSTVRCAGCDNAEVRWFSPQSGGAVCTACRTSGSAPLEAQAAVHLGALLAGDWATATATDVGTAKSVDGMVVAYATWHLDRALRSLPYFER
ncbi:DNA repair protein RecO [Tessaracoccus sp. MC1865]|uniref:DNA repair protein RecO n=1 Tax=unclassified Tessaracoccus TaxID=2635419 RepID=UPI001600A0C7|nr:DNA repair protein RecO [Tessaracoccus sp. MC1865]MBB1484764.1 DNA repair protein RecO [Tessaracoccus sp. MC1865]MBB1510089.1 DNA repair protein RecO [Tessaracoccus sp. MC1756]QTO36298.1 DNA repair protein RecO [Tessaracoccus sp. MC1865]